MFVMKKLSLTIFTLRLDDVNLIWPTTLCMLLNIGRLIYLHVRSTWLAFHRLFRMPFIAIIVVGISSHTYDSHHLGRFTLSCDAPAGAKLRDQRGQMLYRL